LRRAPRGFLALASYLERLPMKASELIDKLQALIDEHDDYEVLACHGTITNPISSAWYLEGEGILDEVILIDIDVRRPPIAN
jgi:hypothetical protein